MRSLTNLGKKTYQVLRQSDDPNNGKWVDGEWVAATKNIITIYANIQPSLLSYQSKMLPESEREKEAIAIFSNHHLYTARTGNVPLEADLVFYRGAYWKVVVSKPYGNFGEHCECLAVRLNDILSPRITDEVKREEFDSVVIV